MLIGVRAANFVTRELRIEVSERIVWRNSQCVLHWLKSKKPLSVFVENRVKEIKEENITSFRYIASNQNPSDLGTRSLLTEEFTSNLYIMVTWSILALVSWPQVDFEEITPEVFNQIKSELKGGEIEITNIASRIKIIRNHYLGSMRRNSFHP